MWKYTIKAEVITGRFSRQVETFSVEADNLTDAIIQIEKNVKIGRVIHYTCAKKEGNETMKALAEIILIIMSVLIALIRTWLVLGPVANSFGPVVAAFSWVIVVCASIVVFNAEIK